MQTPHQILSKSFFEKIIWAYFWACSIFVVSRLIRDYSRGGDPWKQGDWLINSHLLEIRRGLFGSGMLNMSDFLQVPPILLITLIQASLFFIMCYVTAHLIKSNKKNLAILGFLLFSPSALLLYWANNPGGSFRKEIFSFSAMALLIFLNDKKLNHQKRFFNAILALSVSLMAVGMFAHELNLLLLPIYFLIIYSLVCVNNQQQHQWSKKTLAIIVTVLLAAFAYSAYYNLSHASITNINSVCLPLLDRAVPSNLCEGAIKWLNISPQEAREKVAHQLFHSKTYYFLFTIIFGIISVAFFSKYFSHSNRVLSLYAFTGALVLPLYFVALDYGRWSNIHFTAFAYCTLAFSQTSIFSIKSAGEYKVLMTLLILAPFLSPNVMDGKAGYRAVTAILVICVLFGIFHYSEKLSSHRLHL